MEEAEPFLSVLYNGQAYYGDVRLPFHIVDGRLRCRVKEQWLRSKYGDFVEITVSELVAVVEAEKSRQS